VALKSEITLWDSTVFPYRGVLIHLRPYALSVATRPGYWGNPRKSGNWKGQSEQCQRENRREKKISGKKKTKHCEKIILFPLKSWTVIVDLLKILGTFEKSVSKSGKCQENVKAMSGTSEFSGFPDFELSIEK